MTAPKSVDPAGFLREQLETASPDLLRALVTTFADALMSAEADAICDGPVRAAQRRAHQLCDPGPGRDQRRGLGLFRGRRLQTALEQIPGLPTVQAGLSDAQRRGDIMHAAPRFEQIKSASPELRRVGLRHEDDLLHKIVRPLRLLTTVSGDRGQHHPVRRIGSSPPTLAVMFPTITVPEVPADAHLLDVREPDEWAAGHAPGAQHVPMYELPARLAEVPHDRDVVVVCRSGVRSARVVQFLLGNGWERVFNLSGGMEDWAAAGRPLVSDTGTRAWVA